MSISLSSCGVINSADENAAALQSSSGGGSGCLPGISGLRDADCDGNYDYFVPASPEFEAINRDPNLLKSHFNPQNDQVAGYSSSFLDKYFTRAKSVPVSADIWGSFNVSVNALESKSTTLSLSFGLPIPAYLGVSGKASYTQTVAVNYEINVGAYVMISRPHCSDSNKNNDKDCSYLVQNKSAGGYVVNLLGDEYRDDKTKANFFCRGTNTITISNPQSFLRGWAVSLTKIIGISLGSDWLTAVTNGITTSESLKSADYTFLIPGDKSVNRIVTQDEIRNACAMWAEEMYGQKRTSYTLAEHEKIKNIIASRLPQSLGFQDAFYTTCRNPTERSGVNKDYNRQRCDETWQNKYEEMAVKYLNPSNGNSSDLIYPNSVGFHLEGLTPLCENRSISGRSGEQNYFCAMRASRYHSCPIFKDKTSGALVTLSAEQAKNATILDRYNRIRNYGANFKVFTAKERCANYGLKKCTDLIDSDPLIKKVSDSGDILGVQLYYQEIMPEVEMEHFCDESQNLECQLSVDELYGDFTVNSARCVPKSLPGRFRSDKKGQMFFQPIGISRHL